MLTVADSKPSRLAVTVIVPGVKVERTATRSITDIAIEAILSAVGDAGISLDHVDGYVGCPDAPNPTAAARP